MTEALKRSRFRRPVPATCTPAQRLTVVVLALPPVLYLISFSLIMATMNSPDYVRADRVSFGAVETSGTLLNTTQHASLWHYCNSTVGNETDPDFFSEDCQKRPFLGSAGITACELEFRPASRICQKIVKAAELYTAGAVLGGIAFLASTFYAILAVGPRSLNFGYADFGQPEGPLEGNEHARSAKPQGLLTGEVLSEAWGRFSTLLGLSASACLVAGQILGVSALVIEASPSISEPILDATRWYMSKGAAQYTTAAYALGFVGAYVASTGLGVTKLLHSHGTKHESVGTATAEK